MHDTPLVGMNYLVLGRNPADPGARGEFVAAIEDFEAAFQLAVGMGKPALIHIKSDPEVITPGASLRKLRKLALEST